MPECECGCGEKTKGGEFAPGHDQKLRTALEPELEEYFRSETWRMPRNHMRRVTSLWAIWGRS
jgi:hypothetical protein